MTRSLPSPFLTARWIHLAMASYEVDPAVLVPLVPAGTELDLWCGKCFVSMVGFQFRDTRVLGIWHVVEHQLEWDVAALYGPDFAPFVAGQPSSCFVAEGSAVVVRRGAAL